MAFVLRGEIDIDGRKGTAVLRGIQKEATRTSQSFDLASRSTAGLVASFLKANSAASVFGTSLRALGRFGGAGILGAGAATALNRFGEAVKSNATDYFQAQKSLADAFEQSFKSKSVEDAQAALARTSEIADQLRGKITQLGALGGVLEKIEKFTGLKIFGVEDTKKALNQAREQMAAQEEIIELRKREKKEIEAIEEATRGRANQRKVSAETLKFIDAIRKTKNSNVALAELEVETALDLRNENERILEILEKTNTAQRNLDEIQKRRIARAQLELNITKAQQAATIARRAEGGSVLTGSRAGRQALEVAAKQKAEVDRKQAFKDEEKAVEERQARENASREKRGLPMLSARDIRKRMAAEAVGLEIPDVHPAIKEQTPFTQDLLGERKRGMEEAARRQSARPTDFQKRVEEFQERMKSKGLPITPDKPLPSSTEPTEMKGSVKTSQTSDSQGNTSSLIKAVEELVSQIKGAPLVSSAAGSA
jgi:hypothetical protein